MENIDSAIEQLKKDKPVYKEILCFYQSMSRQFKIVKDKIKPSFEISDEDFNVKIENGFQVFEWDKASYPAGALEKCFKIFIDSLQENKQEKFDRIIHLLKNGKLKINSMLKEFSGKNLKYIENIEELDDETIKLLEVFSYLILKPVLEEEVLKFNKKLEKIVWNEPYCPFCGFLPSFAVISGDEGVKSLNCSLCGHRWRFPRLLCTSCKEEIKEYFYDQDDESCKIELCGECKNYLKVFDERNISAAYPPLVKDLITLHLDVIAKERGFSRESGSLFF